MRIAIVLPNLFGGGAERVALALGAGLIDRGHEVDLVLLEPTTNCEEEIPAAARLFRIRARPGRPSGPLCERLERCTPAVLPSAPPRGRVERLLAPGGARLARHKVLTLLGREPSIFRRVDAVTEYVRRERPDCLVPMLARAKIATLAASAGHGRFQQATSTEAARSTRAASTGAAHFPPVVPCVHLPVSSHETTRRRLYRKFLPSAARVVAVSQGLADEVAASTGMPRERVSAIYNPVFGPHLDDRMNATPDHPWLAPGASDGPPVVLAAGRLAPQKDLPLLLRAFARVRVRRRLRLVILGAGPERARLEDMVRELEMEEAVSLPGWAPNPLAFMARASLFVLSSAWEGLGNVLIEALACGCPCVSTDCPHGPAEILGNGDYGRLVPVGDAAALAEAMERTLDAPPGKEALRRRAAFFSRDRAVDAWERLIAEVCEDRHRTLADAGSRNGRASPG